MKKNIDNLIYHIVFSFIYVFSLLPMRVLYLFSNLCYLLVFFVVGYRRRLVWRNLKSSFPEKTRKELLLIESRFYRWFCDYIFETIKLTSISEKEMRRRMQFEGLEEIRQDIANQHSATVYLGHYCNWEWVSSLGIHLPDVICGQIYHELENPVANRFFLKIRGRFKAKSIVMNQTFQTLLKWHKAGKISVTGYISDQAPGFHDMHCWPFFLNHDTPVYTGAERIAKVLDTSIYYADIVRPKRGYYVCRMVKIAESGKSVEPFSPTLAFFRLLEQSIKEHPQYWLWSHNRWKRTREQFNALFTKEQRDIILSRP